MNMLTIIDDYSRYTWTYFLRVKNVTFDCFKQFVTFVENVFPHKVAATTTRESDWNFKVSSLHSGRRVEYLSKSFNTYCLNKGIQRQLTTNRTSHQNGKAESKNRTLIEAAQCLFTSQKFPEYL